MSETKSPAERLRDEAEEKHRPGDRLTVLTDSNSYKNTVLVAVCTEKAACVIQIPSKDYNGMKILEMLGVSFEENNK